MQKQQHLYGSVDPEFEKLDCGCPLDLGVVYGWPTTAPVVVLECPEHNEKSEFLLEPLGD